MEVLEAEEEDEADKPLVEHFRVFGCISHVHVLDSKRTKLDDKSVLMLKKNTL